jgi:hypothetical protein
MRVGVPTEIKTDEHRVAITPAGVRELVDHGNAGRGTYLVTASSRIPVLGAPLAWVMFTRT